jgi:hypothetical protein
MNHPSQHFFGVPIGEEGVPKHQTIVDIYFFIHGWEALWLMPQVN